MKWPFSRAPNPVPPPSTPKKRTLPVTDKFCKDCEHYRQARSYLCSLPRYDRITGPKSPIYGGYQRRAGDCYDEREVNGGCGIEGKYYVYKAPVPEAKPEPTPEPTPEPEPTKPKRVKCKKCVYWEQRATPAGGGDCRIHAPVAVGGEDDRRATWPVSYKKDWCAEGKEVQDEER